jgi:hypothetical protein
LFLSAGPAFAGPVVVSTTLAAEPAPARRGVVVIALGATPPEATWPVAKAIYGDEALRPKLSDGEARALAGEPSDQHKELFELRAQVKGDDVASRAILTEIARRTGARAVVLVAVVDGVTEVRVWDAADGAVGASRHRKEASGWEPLVGVLHGKYGVVVAKAADSPAPSGNSSIAKSPWFWGALGVVVAGGVAVWALTRNDGDARPVRLEWGNR